MVGVRLAGGTEQNTRDAISTLRRKETLRHQAVRCAFSWLRLVVEIVDRYRRHQAAYANGVVIVARPARRRHVFGLGERPTVRRCNALIIKGGSPMEAAERGLFDGAVDPARNDARTMARI